MQPLLWKVEISKSKQMSVEHVVTTRNVESSLCDNVISLNGKNYFCRRKLFARTVFFLRKKPFSIIRQKLANPELQLYDSTSIRRTIYARSTVYQRLRSLW